ncbi:hypothetical protein [Spiroplasma endosymbiont of Virgichneumon dumeticola]|uniref:hypothetical protein n=1 Tax=Spiroplasma endosymbiont of Virgichneumon dumeticola TaxID=3139323 RepID=UPI0035C92E17
MENKNLVVSNNLFDTNFSVAQMKIIPQVSLCYSKDKMANIYTRNELIKKITCLNNDKLELCSEKEICKNCFKIKTNTYFDLKIYDFKKTDIMNKNITLNLIADFSKTSFESNNKKIYLINQIQFISIAAGNSLLKILENLPNNAHIIFTTTSINDIIPTIKSRCQLINAVNSKNNHDNFTDEQKLLIKIFANPNLINDKNVIIKLKSLLTIVEDFITNENSDKINNQLLVKKIANLKEDIIYFFKILYLIYFNKLNIVLFKKYITSNKIIINLVEILKINNHQQIAFILNEIAVVIQVLKYNSNPNLLINAFLVKVSG